MTDGRSKNERPSFTGGRYRCGADRDNDYQMKKHPEKLGCFFSFSVLSVSLKMIL